MPSKAYVGLPRHGKTYEVVVNVILPALRQGRRVVSNIAGLNYEAFCQILFAEGYPQEAIGTLVCVTHEEVEKPTFWRTDKDDAEGIKSFIQPGDVVALDEIWRFFKKRGEIHPRVMNFFRMHGHFSHPETGFTCEIALITQSIKDINEYIREVIEETLQMVKNTKLGSDKSYIVHIFQRGSVMKADFIRTLSPRMYDKKYFPLYKSHSQRKEGDAEALEKNPDKRGSILQGPLFKIVIPLSLVLMAFSVYSVFKFFNPTPVKEEKTESGQNAETPAVGPASAMPQRQVLDISTAWRVVGFYQAGASITATLQDQAGNLRLIANPPNYKLTAIGLEVELPEGGFATPWTTVQDNRRGLMP